MDKRTDIWAFGCVLYEILTGARLFDGEDITEVLGAVIHKNVPWARLPATTPERKRGFPNGKTLASIRVIVNWQAALKDR